MLKLLFLFSSLLLLNLKKDYWYVLKISLIYSTFLCFYYLYSPFSQSCYSSVYFSLDLLSTSLIILTVWISCLMILASQWTYVFHKHEQMFCFWIMTLNIVLILCFSLKNMLYFYFFFEVSLIPILMLILGWGYQPERLQASTYMLLYTVTASLPLLSIIFLMKQLCKSLNYPLFYLLHMNLKFTFSWEFMIWMMMIGAFLVKMPLFLMHLWLPKAHVEAPVSGSMVLAGILLKLGSYGLIRFTTLFLKFNQMFSYIFMSIALWGAVVTGFICLRQVDMKALIAYSSVGHMGLLTGGILTSNSWGWQGSLCMMIAHGLCSSGMFMLANLIYEKSFNRSVFITSGTLNLFPYLTLWWFIFNAINMAAPPSINLFSEISLIISILSYANSTFILLMLISFISAAYSLYLYSVTQHGYVSSYLNFYFSFSSREYLNCFFHFFPSIFLILKLELISSWL